MNTRKPAAAKNLRTGKTASPQHGANAGAEDGEKNGRTDARFAARAAALKRNLAKRKAAKP